MSKKYQYKIIGFVDKFNNTKTFYRFESEFPYHFNVGDEVLFPEDWRRDLGGDYDWKIAKIQHYPVDKFIAIYVSRN